MSREKGRKWDGKSRIPDDTYRNNWNDIFGSKKKPKEKKIKEPVEHLNLEDPLVKQLIKERFDE